MREQERPRFRVDPRMCALRFRSGIPGIECSPGVLFGMRTSSLMKGPRSFDPPAPGAEGGGVPRSVERRDETMAGDPAYLVRYGLMGHVGRFPLDLGRRLEAQIERGQAVVILTDRGVELGEVLVAPVLSSPPSDAAGEAGDGNSPGTSIRAGDAVRDLDPDRPRLLRPAAPADLEAARRSQALRAERFTLCQRILGDGGWSIDLIDVEPLLDQKTTVLHVLGSLEHDMASLRAEFRSRSDFDVLLEPAGSSPGLAREPTGAPEHFPAVQEPVRRCGDCDCSAGGCGAAASASKLSTASIAAPKNDSPGSCQVSSSHSGCASCGVSKWVAHKRRTGRR